MGFQWPSRSNDSLWQGAQQSAEAHPLLVPSPPLETSGENVSLASPPSPEAITGQRSNVSKNVIVKSPWTSEEKSLVPKETKASPVPSIAGFPSSQPKSWSIYPVSGTCALSTPTSTMPDCLSTTYGSAECFS